MKRKPDLYRRVRRAIREVADRPGLAVFDINAPLCRRPRRAFVRGVLVQVNIPDYQKRNVILAAHRRVAGYEP